MTKARGPKPLPSPYQLALRTPLVTFYKNEAGELFVLHRETLPDGPSYMSLMHVLSRAEAQGFSTYDYTEGDNKENLALDARLAYDFDDEVLELRWFKPANKTQRASYEKWKREQERKDQENKKTADQKVIDRLTQTALQYGYKLVKQEAV